MDIDLSDSKILIIGAGPTGLTVALEFIKHGIKVDIVEKRSSPSTLSRAVGILPESLTKLGGRVAERIFEESIPFMKINMHVDTSRVLSVDLKDRVNPKDVITGLPQDRTEEIMRDELAVQGVDVKYACAVSGISTTDTSAQVRFDGGENPVQYDWVVACDGVNSLVRKQLGIEFPGYDLEKKWSIADVELNNMHDFAANNVWTKVGEENDTFVCLPIAENRIRLISTTDQCLEKVPATLDIKQINRQGEFTISIRQAKTYKKGRVLLAGDAAHCHSPVGGRGMNLGIADAVDAAQAIMRGTTDSYTKIRHAEGAKIIRQSEAMRKRIMSKNPFVKLMLKTMLGLINRFSWLQTFAIKRVSRL